ncbi:MAG: hypothetical protein WBV82_25445 [Myxococcaceae bacterium]
MLALLVTVLLGLSVQEHLEGAEIGDAVWAVSFRTGGRYRAEHSAEKGSTVARGTWRIRGDHLEVKVASCKGVECERVGKGYLATVALPAENAMTVRSEPSDALLPSGSYYCVAQGCEKRLGIEVTGAASPEFKASVLALLTERDATREKTVAWVDAKDARRETRTRIEICRREPERGRAAAELVVGDLASFHGLQRIAVEAGPTDCLYDVRLVLGSDVR